MDFKEKLALSLDGAVNSAFPGTERLRFEETDRGFFCDYDMEPLRPEGFEAIKAAMRRLAPKGFYGLSGFSGAYAGDSAENRMLQRVYVDAFETKEAFEENREKAAKAAARDHKLLGAQLKLFSGSEDIGQGLILWHPKGAMLRLLLERFSQQTNILNGYQWVYTPHIGRAGLWQRSGHLDYYRDSMYNPLDIDGELYYLKPMSCPFHIAIYNSEPRSYRELPYRVAEFGTVYRYELSGTLSGLTRVRGFTQDDAHIICTPEQIGEEIEKALALSVYMLNAFGFDEFDAYVSTKPEKKSIGSDENWDAATRVLKDAVRRAGLPLKIDEGGGAFYGPKIDLKLKDSLGREWQCSTIQFDFNLPERFQMRYIGADGKRHTPYMVHRALFGSLERFCAMLIEHYAGDFPFWLSPVQIGIVPVSPAQHAYCRALETELRRPGFRVKADLGDGHMRSKIKAFELEKLPYILIAGAREEAGGTFSVRSRKQGAGFETTLGGFLEHLEPEIAMGVPKYVG